MADDDIVTMGGPERASRRRPGTEEAIESLFHACYPRLVFTAFSLVDDWDLAEQLAREAYLRLWRRWRWISDPQAAPMYLQRTVVNLSRETIRRRVIERRVLRARSLDGPPQPPADPADVVDLRPAIAGLPARQRECVVLRHLLGLSEEETASVLRISIGTVKSQTHKGLHQLRQHFDGPSRGDPRNPRGAAPGADPRNPRGAAPGADPRNPRRGRAVGHGREADMTNTDLEQRLSGLLEQTAATRPIDTSRAWREFQQRRSRASKNRHTGLTAALAVAAVVAIIMAARTGRLFGVTPHGSSAGLIDGPARTRVYPGAIVARIPVSGVVSLVADGPSVWVVHAYGQVGISVSYQLVKIDERTNKVTLAVNLRYLPGSVAASAGMLWLTTGQGRARGQLVRLDPATGRAIATVHLATGPCDLVIFSLGSLWATCSEGASRTEFLRLDPGTGQVTGQAGPVRAIVGAIAAAPGGIWFGDSFSPSGGIVRLGHPHGQLITLRPPDRPVNYGGPQPMVYGQGFAWVLSTDESVAKIDAVTGRVLRFYTYRAYDPGHAGGLDYFTVGNGSLWFLDDGYPFSGMLRVSLATGRPLGAVAAPRSGDCGPTPCAQIYSTPGAIWVPTALSLIRIDPARLPG